MTTRPTILVVSDAVVPTGYARLSAALITRFLAHFDVHQVGLNYTGPMLQTPWPLHPSPGHQYPQGLSLLRQAILEISPDIVLLINDLNVLMRYATELGDLRPLSCFVAYFPIESGPIEPEVLAPSMSFYHHLATYTEFAAREVRRALSILPNSRHAAGRLSIIPHGVDSRHFYPLCGRSPDKLRQSQLQARQRLFPNAPNVEDMFLVLNANRNQPRKRIDITLEAFSLFAQGKPEAVKLYLHMGLQDRGWNILLLGRRYGILERIILTTDAPEMVDVSIETLNLIYNACDVGLNTCCAEGWGLVAFEHAATGRPQIVPRHTSQIELWEGAARLVPPSRTIVSERDLTDIHLVSPADVARELEQLYQEPHYRASAGRACLARATDPKLDWNKISAQWRKLFFDVLAKEHFADAAMTA